MNQGGLRLYGAPGSDVARVWAARGGPWNWRHRSP